MSRMSSPLRRRKASKRLDLSDMKHALRDGRIWCALGVVTKPEGSDSHFEVVTEFGQPVEVLVEVVTMPGGLELSCRLGSFAGGPGMGLWRVPAEGDEVAVMVPDGEIEFQPTIVAVLSTGEVPERLGEGRTILVATDQVEVIAPKVYLGPDPDTIVEGTDGLVHGTGIDPFTGATYAALSNTTGKVFSKK